MQEIRNNNSSSGYSTHVLNTEKKQTPQDFIRTYRKAKHLNMLEKYHIYKISKDSLQMNDTHTHTDIRNPLLKALQVMNEG
jgi:hypothetical protein